MGEVLTITVSGPQGSGKTALLKLINSALIRDGHGSLMRCLNGKMETATVVLEDPVDLAKAVSQLGLPDSRER